LYYITFTLAIYTRYIIYGTLYIYMLYYIMLHYIYNMLIYCIISYAMLLYYIKSHKTLLSFFHSMISA